MERLIYSPSRTTDLRDMLKASFEAGAIQGRQEVLTWMTEDCTEHFGKGKGKKGHCVFCCAEKFPEWARDKAI